MVDCGSMNLKVREDDINFKDYVNNFIVPRYQDVKHKKFLLTHFHRDHVCGLYYILDENPVYFDEIYLPGVVKDYTGRAYLIEFCLYVNAFLPRNFGSSFVSTSALKIFSRLKNTIGTGKFFTLFQGDTFSVSDVNYSVLWPVRENDFIFSDVIIESVTKIESYIKSMYPSRISKKFMSLKDDFLNEYIKCSYLCGKSTESANAEIDESIEKLERLICDMEEMSIDLANYSVFNDIKKIILDFDVIRGYGHDLNSQSLVFHNEILLMTGDATKYVFDSIYDKLLGSYFYFKAPHHGTESGWSDHFKTIIKRHTIISNGNYHAAGKIFKEYFQDDSIKHCTNPDVCEYFKENKDCCNRLKYCCENKTFVFKCNNKDETNGISKCGVYVVSCYKDKGCTSIGTIEQKNNKFVMH